MNLLSLISLWLNIICQVIIKYATVISYHLSANWTGLAVDCSAHSTVAAVHG